MSCIDNDDGVSVSFPFIINIGIQLKCLHRSYKNSLTK